MTPDRSTQALLGSFALVLYIPEPLGKSLYSLRQSLSGDQTPQAHITILPPRPLTTPVAIASLEAKKILQAFQPFDVRLSNVRVFPETNILYLEIAAGSGALHQLHDALDTGSLAHEENFEFLPHLTISEPVENADLERVYAEATQAWATLLPDASFEVSEVVALWQPPQGSKNDWDRLWSVKLGSHHSNTARVP